MVGDSRTTPLFIGGILLSMVALVLFGVILLRQYFLNNDPVNEPGQSINFTTLARGDGGDSAVSQKTDLVITNESEFSNLLDRVFPGVSTRKLSSDSADFDTEMVIAVFAGRQGSGGYDIGVNDVKETLDHNLVVTVTDTRPGGGCNSLDVVIAPYQIIKVKLVPGKVTFKHQTLIETC